MKPPYSQGRLLIVEDPSMTQLSARKALNESGLILLAATTSAEAFDMSVDLTPDLILLDLDYLGAEGLKVCHRLHQDPETASLPIITLGSSWRDDSLEAGAIAHLDKPISSGRLLRQIKNLIRLQAQQRRLETKLRQAERRERVRDEWITYVVDEVDEALTSLSTKPDATNLVEKVQALTQTILACRQMSHPKAFVTLQSCSLAEIVETLDEPLVYDDIQGEVQADPTLVTRILNHLIRIARDHGGPEHQPRVMVRNHCDDQLTTEIMVGGSGIWHGSYAALDPGSTATQGLDCQNRTELSLAFCRHAIDLMGGSIGVEALPGSSLRFWFSLPSVAQTPLPNIIPFASRAVSYDQAASR